MARCDWVMARAHVGRGARTRGGSRRRSPPPPPRARAVVLRAPFALLERNRRVVSAADVFELPSGWSGDVQLMFLLGVYSYILYIACSLISEGADLLMLTKYSKLVGSCVLPVLGAVPDGAIVLFSGIGPEAQTQLKVGIGALAGSTVMLLTIPWVLAVYGGRVDIDAKTGDAVYQPATKGEPRLTPSSDGLFSSSQLLGTGVGTQANPACIKVMAWWMVATSLPLVIIQLAAFVAWDVDDEAALGRKESIAALVAFLYSVSTAPTARRTEPPPRFVVVPITSSVVGRVRSESALARARAMSAPVRHRVRRRKSQSPRRRRATPLRQCARAAVSSQPRSRTAVSFRPPPRGRRRTTAPRPPPRLVDDGVRNAQLGGFFGYLFYQWRTSHAEPSEDDDLGPAAGSGSAYFEKKADLIVAAITKGHIGLVAAVKPFLADAQPRPRRSGRGAFSSRDAEKGVSLVENENASPVHTAAIQHSEANDIAPMADAPAAAGGGGADEFADLGGEADDADGAVSAAAPALDPAAGSVSGRYADPNGLSTFQLLMLKKVRLEHDRSR